MGRIATESEANNIGLGGAIIWGTDRCCTKTKAETLNCEVSGTYKSNQLVQKDHLSKTITIYTWTFTITNASYNETYVHMLSNGIPSNPDTNEYDTMHWASPIVLEFTENGGGSINEQNGYYTTDIDVGNKLYWSIYKFDNWTTLGTYTLSLKNANYTARG